MGKEMSLMELVKWLLEQDKKYTLLARVYDKPKYILIGIDKEDKDEGD